MRAFLQIVVPLVLPLLLYLLWAYMVAPEKRERLLRDMPWLAIIASGALLAGTSLLLWALMGGEPAGSTYRAPRLEGDRVIPGGFE